MYKRQLDEPSAVLTDTEIDDLFVFIRQLKKTGVGIIYISHRMDELKRITDRITVMRDGQYVDTLETPTAEISEVIRLMVGRTIYEEPKTKSMCPPDAPVVLEAEHLCSLDVKDVSFQLHKGEILGFAGLVGAGRTEIMRGLFGVDYITSCDVYVHGQKVRIPTPAAAKKHGIAFLTEDRKIEGLTLDFTIKANMSMANLPKLRRGLLTSTKVENEIADQYIKLINVKTPSRNQKVGNLSGGNQQKVVIGRTLNAEPRIVILDEPTKGIDVGAKAEIYNLINQLAERGVAVVLISSELPELMAMSDRFLVMAEGRVAGELSKEEATEAKIMNLATTTYKTF